MDIQYVPGIVQGDDAQWWKKVTVSLPEVHSQEKEGGNTQCTLTDREKSLYLLDVFASKNKDGGFNKWGFGFFPQV